MFKQIIGKCRISRPFPSGRDKREGLGVRPFLALLFLLITFSSTAQPYVDEITAFKKKDSISFPPKNATLFVGSSSFRLWDNIEGYFPGYTIINRGFGGSSLPDVIRYEKDIIFPYQPKQVVIYCGENDVAGDSMVTGKIVAERFQQLFTDIRNQWPGMPVVFVSIKPSPSRWHLREKMMDANKRIRKYLKKKKNTDYIDVWTPMLGIDGKPREILFREDMLHMKPTGYAIWAHEILPVLIK